MAVGGEGGEGEGRFINPIPNSARYQKSNLATLEDLCVAALHGDFDQLEALLSTGDEDSIFNGDVNKHYTDVTALHMAAMGGHGKCVELLLEARADPHVRAVVPSGKEPSEGETARAKALKFKHTDVVKMLQQAEEDSPPGWYAPDGICNNRKLYRKPQAAPAQPPAAAGAATVVGKAPPAASAPPPTPQEPPLPIALLFPGQGSQYVKMLEAVQDLPAVKEMLSKAESILGYNLLDLCLKGPEEKLAETRYCQPAMFVGGLAAVEKLRKDREEAATRRQAVAGLSLGEYTALCCAGVFSFEDGLRLVKLRGEAMQEAAQVGAQAMLSVVGLEEKVLKDLCAQAAKKEGGAGAVCQIANVLFPKGFSCAGTAKAIEALKGLAEKKGALQVKQLKTSGGFHTPLMQPAQEKLQKALDEVRPNMKPPQCDVYMNVTGKALARGTDPGEFLELLKKQLVNPVQWQPSVASMIQAGIAEFYECGPQKQIKAMMKRIDNKVWTKTTNVEV